MSSPPPFRGPRLNRNKSDAPNHLSTSHTPSYLASLQNTSTSCLNTSGQFQLHRHINHPFTQNPMGPTITTITDITNLLQPSSLDYHNQHNHPSFSSVTEIAPPHPNPTIPPISLLSKSPAILPSLIHSNQDQNLDDTNTPMSLMIMNPNYITNASFSGGGGHISNPLLLGPDCGLQSQQTPLQNVPASPVKSINRTMSRKLHNDKQDQQPNTTNNIPNFTHNNPFSPSAPVFSSQHSEHRPVSPTGLSKITCPNNNTCNNNNDSNREINHISSSSESKFARENPDTDPFTMIFAHMDRNNIILLQQFQALEQRFTSLEKNFDELKAILTHNSLISQQHAQHCPTIPPNENIQSIFPTSSSSSPPVENNLMVPQNTSLNHLPNTITSTKASLLSSRQKSGHLNGLKYSGAVIPLKLQQFAVNDEELFLENDIDDMNENVAVIDNLTPTTFATKRPLVLPTQLKNVKKTRFNHNNDIKDSLRGTSLNQQADENMMIDIQPPDHFPGINPTTTAIKKPHKKDHSTHSNSKKKTQSPNQQVVEDLKTLIPIVEQPVSSDMSSPIDSNSDEEQESYRKPRAPLRIAAHKDSTLSQPHLTSKPKPTHLTSTKSKINPPASSTQSSLCIQRYGVHDFSKDPTLASTTSTTPYESFPQFPLLTTIPLNLLPAPAAPSSRSRSRTTGQLDIDTSVLRSIISILSRAYISNHISRTWLFAIKQSSPFKTSSPPITNIRQFLLSSKVFTVFSKYKRDADDFRDLLISAYPNAGLENVENPIQVFPTYVPCLTCAMFNLASVVIKKCTSSNGTRVDSPDSVFAYEPPIVTHTSVDQTGGDSQDPLSHATYTRTDRVQDIIALQRIPYYKLHATLPFPVLNFALPNLQSFVAARPAFDTMVAAMTTGLSTKGSTGRVGSKPWAPADMCVTLSSCAQCKINFGNLSMICPVCLHIPNQEDLNTMSASGRRECARCVGVVRPSLLKQIEAVDKKNAMKSEKEGTRGIFSLFSTSKGLMIDSNFFDHFKQIYPNPLCDELFLPNTYSEDQQSSDVKLATFFTPGKYLNLKNKPPQSIATQVLTEDPANITVTQFPIPQDLDDVKKSLLKYAIPIFGLTSSVESVSSEIGTTEYTSSLAHPFATDDPAVIATRKAQINAKFNSLGGAFEICTIREINPAIYHILDRGMSHPISMYFSLLYAFSYYCPPTGFVKDYKFYDNIMENASLPLLIRYLVDAKD